VCRPSRQNERPLSQRECKRGQGLLHGDATGTCPEWAGPYSLRQQLRRRGRAAVGQEHLAPLRLFVLADASADPDPENHELLTRKIFPRQAEVIEVADLETLLG